MTDDGAPNLSDSETLTIAVTEEPNTAPVLDSIGIQSIDEESELSFTATATDADTGDVLTFSLDAHGSAERHATIDPVTGRLQPGHRPRTEGPDARSTITITGD